ncbi:MAG: hypothetical protein H6651_21715 [Ardenticatenales bacterium]|nr:hypothetical protein [Ardenticatenales bacterium]
MKTSKAMRNFSFWRRGVLSGLAALLLFQLGCSNLPFLNSDPTATPEPLPTLATSVDEAAQTEDGAVSGATVKVQVDTIQALVLESNPVQVSVLIRGSLPDDCSSFTGLEQSRSDNRFLIVLTAVRPEGATCNEVQVPFDQAIDLDVAGLAPGYYEIEAHDVVAGFQLGEAAPAETTTGNVPPAPSADGGNIVGVVWSDVCQVAADGTPSAFCEAVGDGTFGPDGEFNVGEERLEGVVVHISPGSCPPAGQIFFTASTGSDGAYRLGNLAPGDYCLSVDETAEENQFILGNGSWTGAGGNVQQVTVEVGNTTTVNFGWAFPAEQAAPPTIDPDCTNAASFVSDVTIPDNTVIAPGATFAKTWRLANTGDCTWGLGYSLVFADGDQMGAPDEVSMTQSVPPGESVDLTVNFTAPVTPGTYRSDWLLADPLGNTFGLGAAGNTFYMQIVVNQSAGGSNTGGTGSGGDSGRVNGIVWADNCVNGGAGCVADGNGGFVANGIRDAGETGIGGIIVTVSSGACTADGRPAGTILAIATTGTDGAFTFDNLAAGDYCVHVDQLAVDNAPRLLPGSWSAPGLGVSGQTVSVTAGATATANFGWDSQE